MLPSTQLSVAIEDPFANVTNLYRASTVSFFAENAATSALTASFALASLLFLLLPSDLSILPEISITSTISTFALLTCVPTEPEAFNVMSYVPSAFFLMYFSCDILFSTSSPKPPPF